MGIFNPNCATDAVALLVELAGGRLNRVAVLKLLYLAEREALAKYGTSITGSQFYSLPHGPISSEVYGLIKGDWQSERWSAYLRSDGNDVVLIRERSNDWLREADEELLMKHWDEHRCGDGFPDALVGFSHDLPEWSRPRGEKSVPITERQMLEAQGVGWERIDAVERLQEGVRAMHNLGELRV